MNKESVTALLAEINDENSGRDLVSAGVVREVGVHDGTVKMAPRPFLDEPFKRHYPDYEADLLEELVNI